MPIDKPEATATDNPRRSFLARAAVGGALVTAGSIAGPLLRTVPAGAQGTAEAGSLDDGDYATWLAPLELAAVQIYSAALAVDGLSADVSDALNQFQANHQSAADTIGAMYSGDTPLDEDPTLLATASSVGSDQAAVLASLTDLENNLAATHLSALAGIADPITAKTAAQVLAVEGQQAVALGLLADADLAALTPASVTTDGAYPKSSAVPASTTSTTAAAGGSTTTEEAGN
ncbi:MAG: ferritin-like domain-containing protein [Acidimicrobiales bacterium]|nr:ferritin-like domain-containing protein [Acidimicrobiales bacterium]